MEDPKIFKEPFTDLSWKGWKTFLRATFGLKMEEDDYQLFRECTQRKITSDKGFDEVYAIVGRRGGKSFISALIAVYLSLFWDWKKYLRKGEIAYFFIISTDRDQAKNTLSYVKGILDDFPGAVKKSKTLEVELTNGICISVKPASFRSGRGFTCIGIILDELAFFRSEESANPAEEILTALLPTLCPGGKVIGISTPYGKFGYLYQVYKDYFGKEDDEILVWKAPTKIMNPTYRDSIIKRMLKRDKAKMRSEYGAEFREDIESFLTEMMIEKIRTNVDWHPFQPGIRYQAFVDPSGGSNDSMTLAIGHLTHEEMIIIDDVEEVKPPFDPDATVKIFADLLKEYGINQVVGDKYAGEWPSSIFKKNGINYIKSDLTKSELYLYFQPIVAMEKIKIPNNERLKNQFLLLERRVHPGGKDVVDHPKGNCHDDLANAVAGVSVLIYKGIFKKATPEELESRLPRVLSKLFPTRNLERKMLREGRLRKTPQELEDERKEREAKRKYKQNFGNVPAKEMDFLMLEEKIPCTRCNGTGIDDDETCGKCKGSGTIRKYSKPTYIG